VRFLGIDVGTTRMKCGIYEENGECVFSEGIDYGEVRKGEENYVDIEAIKNNAITLLKKAYKAFPYNSIAVSSFGESFVALDKDDNPIFLPMLYIDQRGTKEALDADEYREELYSISGVLPHGMYSAYKLKWIKNNKPEIYKNIDKVLLMDEFVSYILTGIRGIDYALAARTGVFDVRKKEFSKRACDLIGVDVKLFSPAVPCGTIIGKLKDELIKDWEAKDVYVVAGGHDQVCATIGSGITEAGLCTDGMGTCECITAVYDKFPEDLKMGECGYSNVPFGKDLFCTYLLSNTCGSLQRWWLANCYPEEDVISGNVFPIVEKDFTEEPTGKLVLPYFGGAATPFNDPFAKGAFVNLTLQDTPTTVFQAILEGLTFEMKLNLDTAKKFGINPKRLVVTGGGAKDKKWLQMKADILGLPLYPLKTKEAGICGAAILGASALLKKDLKEVAKVFVKYGEPYLPRKEKTVLYKEWYKKYTKLYKALKAFK